MSFNYYETYRTESELDTYKFPVLRGASNVEARTWVFFGTELDPYKHHLPAFNVARFIECPEGVVDIVDADGHSIRFIPLTVEYIREHPEQYSWISPSTVNALKSPDMMSLFFTGLIPEWYVEHFGPPEEQE